MAIVPYWFNKTGGTNFAANGTWITTNSASLGFAYDYSIADTVRITIGSNTWDFEAPYADESNIRLNITFSATASAGDNLKIVLRAQDGYEIVSINGNLVNNITGTHTLRMVIENGYWEEFGHQVTIIWGSGFSDSNGDLRLNEGTDTVSTSAIGMFAGL